MNRLTKERQIGPYASLKDKAEAVPGAFGTYDCLYAHMQAVTRLKKYEDTGLEPEEIETLLAERKAILHELAIYGSCAICANSYAENNGEPCKFRETCYPRKHWKWRGRPTPDPR